MARLFVAAYPPAEVLDLLEGLDRPSEAGVRWVPRDRLHVTLRFMGEADEDEARAAFDESRVPSALALMGPAVSRLGREVVCIPVQGLDELAGSIASGTATVGEPADPRPFAGHLTLGRFRRRRSCGLVGQRFEASFPVSEVHLVRSELRSGGAAHRSIATKRTVDEHA